MTAAEKRKYVAAKLLESIAPYGYFLRYGAIWKYSMDGKYVVCISFHLGRIGDLIDIYIGFGSFFLYPILLICTIKDLYLDCVIALESAAFFISAAIETFHLLFK